MTDPLLSSKTESSEVQRRNAFANFLAAVDAKDMPMSMTATFQAGWDAAMRRPRSPPETNEPVGAQISGGRCWHCHNQIMVAPELGCPTCGREQDLQVLYFGQPSLKANEVLDRNRDKRFVGHEIGSENGKA